MEEKRKFKRINVTLKSEVHSEEAMTFSSINDLSDGGIFISTPEPLPDGSAVNLSLQSADGREINVKGIVKWTRNSESEDIRSGMGIEFTEMTDDTSKALKNILQ